MSLVLLQEFLRVDVRLLPQWENRVGLMRRRRQRSAVGLVVERMMIGMGVEAAVMRVRVELVRGQGEDVAFVVLVVVVVMKVLFLADVCDLDLLL